MADPLDRPIWHALTGRQAGFALGTGLVRRFRPDVSPFAACADDSPAALEAAARLLGPTDQMLFVQRGKVAVPPHTRVVERGAGVQMSPSALSRRRRRRGSSRWARTLRRRCLGLRP